MKLVCRSEHFAKKMVEDKNPAQDMVDITGHVVHESASYDKDVVEIKLPDSDISSDYCGNFVKDVCIDDGQPPPRKISEGKVADEKPSPNFDYQKIHANGDPRYGVADYATKSAHEVKPEIVLPVGFAPDSNNEKQYSSREEYDLEGRSKLTNIAGDLSEKKISLEELLRLESAEESQQKGAVSSENSQNHMPSLHGEAVGQVSLNDCYGIEAIASETSELVNNNVYSNEDAGDFPATTSIERDAAASFDARGPNQVDHYNPFVGHGSPEGTCQPECSTSADIDAASTGPICTAEKTDEVKTDEPRIDALSSSITESKSSEKSNDQDESIAIVHEAITGEVDETAVATTSSTNNLDPNGANGDNNKKLENDDITPVHDSTQSDEGSCLDTMNHDVVSKSSMQTEKDNLGEQMVTNSPKVTSEIGHGYPPFEPGLFGPSIMSAPVSNSGHIAYSGNISIRSDSSTTSTRSFAFPVLQRDGISSPVRMAKGERRRIRRRRSWRKGLLCCKF